MKVKTYSSVPRPFPGAGVADQMIDALYGGHVVDFMYDGKYRVGEVHAVGQSATGKLVARVYQFDGRASRPLPQWTLFDLGKVELLEQKAVRSQAPREGYAEGDKQMPVVIAEIVL